MILEDIKLKDGSKLKRVSKCCNAPIKVVGWMIKTPECTNCGGYALEVHQKS